MNKVSLCVWVFFLLKGKHEFGFACVCMSIIAVIPIV